MGSIIHPWNLVMVLFVTSVAAMVHSADDMDAGSVTVDHPEPRGDNANGLQRIAPVSKGHIKRYDDIYGDFLPALSSVDNRPMMRRGNTKRRAGSFTICVKMSSEHYGGPSSSYYILAQVLYNGGPYNWGSNEIIGTTNVDALSEACYVLQNKSYYRNKVLGPIAIFNENRDYGWFPRCISIRDPADRVYSCHYGKQCCLGTGPGAGVCSRERCEIKYPDPKYISCVRSQQGGCPEPR